GLPPDAPAWKGYTIFRSECIACHAINGEGGTIGPELNVPQSIVEYRPEEQLKAYIRKPETFRYTSMPSHEHLTPADLDAVIAYFRAMRDRKHDPKAASRTGAPWARASPSPEPGCTRGRAASPPATVTSSSTCVAT